VRIGCLLTMAMMQLLPLLVLACISQSQAAFNIAQYCPGNLVKNGGFELPNPSVTPSEVPGHGNSRWGWYSKNKVPGWYTNCIKTDWQSPNAQKYMEIARNSVATAPEGMQYMELLPNGTGNSCQDINLVKGATYRLRFNYGRLMTYAWRPPYTGVFEKFETMAAAGVRDFYAPRPAKPNIFAFEGSIKDTQGFKVLVHADTTKQPKQWQEYSATFQAPSNKIQLLFTTTKRPKECGSCGSMLDAVCLQKVA
jgi:hypothetical protein